MSRVDFIAAKAERLHAAGAVTPVPSPTAFLVQGSAPRPYMVVLAEVPGVGVTSWCSCPAGRIDCAHVQAARRQAAAIAADFAPRCHGAGELEEVLGRDSFGNYDTKSWPCPGCADCTQAEVAA